MRPARSAPICAASMGCRRLGSSAGTTRGLGTDEFTRIGTMIADLFDAATADAAVLEKTQARVRAEVAELCALFPIYV